MLWDLPVIRHFEGKSALKPPKKLEGYFACSPEEFCEYFFACLPGNFALKNGGDFWWIFSGLRLPRNEARKILEKFGKNSEQNSGQNSGRKFEKFGKLSFCKFSDLTKSDFKVTFAPWKNDPLRAQKWLKSDFSDRFQTQEVTFESRSSPSGVILPKVGKSLWSHFLVRWIQKLRFHCRSPETWFRGKFSVKWFGLSPEPKVRVTGQKSELRTKKSKLQPGRPTESEPNRPFGKLSFCNLSDLMEGQGLPADRGGVWVGGLWWNSICSEPPVWGHQKGICSDLFSGMSQFVPICSDLLGRGQTCNN